MPLSITGGNVQEKAAKQSWDNFKLAEAPFVSKYNALSGSDKSSLLGIITNWNFQAASPTVNRENALFVAIALLYLVVGYLARIYIKNGS